MENWLFAPGLSSAACSLRTEDARSSQSIRAAWPSIPTLAREALASPATAKRDLSYLQQHASFKSSHHSSTGADGLGSNLYRLGIPDMVIQRILRHANVSTTTTYYIKTAADDVREAMAKLETVIPIAPYTPETRTTETRIIPPVSDLRDSFGTLSTESRAVSGLPN